jgi:hypothetical protein
VSAHGSRATVHDGIDRTILLIRQSMGLAVSGALLSKNIGQLEGWLIQRLPLLA